MRRDPLEIYNNDTIRREISMALVENAKISEHQAEGLADALLDHGVLNPVTFYSRKDLKALERLNRCLIELSRALSDAAIGNSARELLARNLAFGNFAPDMNSGGFDGEDPRAQELMQYIKEVGSPNEAALSHVAEHSYEIRSGVRQTISDIESAESTKAEGSQLNVEGVSIVEAARFIWYLATDRNAPSGTSLNDATPFANFLRRSLAACGVSGSTRAIYRAWARERGSLD